MKKRVLYGTAIVLLAISVVLVVWLGSFNLGDYGPSNPQQTFLFWAVSILIFILMVTLGFILVRTGVKLYVERQSNREGSRIKTKLVVGALALSFMPAFFLVLFSYLILNVNLQRWLLAPGDAERRTFIEMGQRVPEGTGPAGRPAGRPAAPSCRRRRPGHRGVRSPGFLERFSKQQELDSAAILPVIRRAAARFVRSLSHPALQQPRHRLARAHSGWQEDPGIRRGVRPAFRSTSPRSRQPSTRYNKSYLALHDQRQNIRNLSLMFMALITLFVLYVATWIALFMSRKISGPISALLTAAGRCGRAICATAWTSGPRTSWPAWCAASTK